MKYRFVDLCAGIGGFHQAFKKLGMECVYASEIDETARKSYMHNFAFPEERFNRDIYDLDTSHIEDFDICCAGFPCQPFSLIGKKKGFDEMLEQSQKQPLVCPISLHPFVIGRPYRIRRLRRAFEHIISHRDEIWLTRPHNICEHIESLPSEVVPG